MIEKIKSFWVLFLKVLKFEVFYKFGIIVIISPLLNKIIQIYLDNKSQGGAFNQYILFDFLSAEGIILILLVMAGFLAVIIYELTVIIDLVVLNKERHDYRIADVMKSALLNLKCLLHPSSLIAGFYYILLLPLVHIGYLNSLIPSISIPNFVFGELKLTFIGQILIILINVIYHGIYLLLFLVPIFMVLKKDSFYQALKNSFQTLKSLEFVQWLKVIALLGGWYLIEQLLKQGLPNALIKNADFNRYFLKNLITFSQFRLYLFQYLLYSIIMILIMIIFYQVVLGIVAKYDQSIVKVDLDHGFNQTFDETLLEAKIQGSIGYQYLDKYIFKNHFYQKHWGIINIIFWSVLFIIVTYIAPNSIYIFCTILIVVIVMYFIASILVRYDSMRYHEEVKVNKSMLFLPYRVIQKILNRSKLYNRHPRVISLTLIAIAVILVAAYLEPGTMVHHPWVIGHRGSHYGVENTYSAIKAANDKGANYAEIDVQLSSDNVVIVMHDSDLSRLAGKRSKVADLTADELAKVDLKQNGYEDNASSLDKLIKRLKKAKAKMGLLIELKTDNSDGKKLAKEVIKVVEKNDYEDQAIFMSLDYDVVTYLQESRPEWWIGYCIYGSAGDLDESLWNLNIDFLAIEENRATVSFIEKANRNWVPVYVWTVDDVKKMSQYLQMGVSGIITNYPDYGRDAIDDYLTHNYQYYYYQGDGYPTT